MIRALVILAFALAACGGQTTDDPTQEAPEAGGSGEVTFGKGLDDDLQIEQEQDTFAVGETGAFSGEFTEAAGATSLEIIISSREAGGAEGVVYTETVTIGNPEFTVFGVEDIDLSALVSGTGDYVLRFYRDATELAEGDFTISD